MACVCNDVQTILLRELDHIAPEVPAAPVTSNVSPRESCAASKAAQAVIAFISKVDAEEMSTPMGAATTDSAGTTTWPA